MYILVGKIITTHGIDGEIKIRSDFSNKDDVFKVGNKLYIGELKEEMEILSYRVHKDYDMVKLSNIVSIDKAILYKQKDVFIDDKKTSFSTLIKEDYYDSKVFFKGIELGVVSDIVSYGRNNYVFVIKNSDKEILIPFNENFIEKFDLDNKNLYLKNVEGLL